VIRAIMPDFSLRDMLTRWTEISTQLAESPRQRLLQAQKFAKTS
jgi:hypothetical protein